MAETSGYRVRNSTADRALTVLLLFADDHLVLSATEVAEHLGVARSTAYRYLQTLVQAEFLLEDGRGGFRLGLRVLELARLARRSHDLNDLAVPAMRALTDRFHQTVLLTRQMGQSIVCLEREESRQQYLRLSYERGTVLGLNAGASAEVLLAWLPEPEVRELLASLPLARFTDATITDPDEFVRRLAEIREQGYAVTYGEVDADAVGIAAPVFRSPGQVTAAISVVLIQSRVPQEDLETIVAAVTESARLLSDQVALLT